MAVIYARVSTAEQAASALIVYETSRLTRDVIEAKIIKRAIAKLGVRLIYTKQEFDDDPQRQILDTMLQAIDEHKLAVKRERAANS